MNYFFDRSILFWGYEIKIQKMIFTPRFLNRRYSNFMNFRRNNMSELRISNYKENKAISVVSMLLQLSKGHCDKYWLNKIMYYVERQSLIKSGQPMFFDQLYSVPFGPIASAVNDGIDTAEYPTIDSPWTNYFSVEGQKVKLRKEADYSVLSPFEEEIIKEAFHKFKGWSFTQLKEYFHHLPEYIETSSREIINYDVILEAEGYSKKQIKETIEEISYINFFECKLNCAS
jgi:uncharacterized phage-associated protein